jgi:HPt (histidine-containing phosphotransfer) domain-containing protein
MTADLEHAGLVLLDVAMPGTDGPAAAAAILALADPPPLVGLIAAGHSGEAARARAAGMLDALQKPVRRDALAASLDRLFREPEGAPMPIDLDHLARYTAGDAELERELFALFTGNAETYLAELAQVSAAGGDDQTWHRAAHTLKGAARGIGAARVPALAETAERLVGAAAEPPARAAAIARLRAAVAVVRRAVHPARLESRRAAALNAGSSGSDGRV